MDIDVTSLLAHYRSMFRIRRFEEEAARAYAQGKIGGFLHLYIGQEAIAVGSAAALRSTDYVLQTYRDHGTALALGMSPHAAMAELFGRDAGCSRGLGGSMHFFDVEHRFLGGWGIVGGHTALAAGVAYKAKYLGEDYVTLCFFGEGATNIGAFHEALSLAGLWKLPVIFICENNGYAMGTPLERTSPVSDLSVKARGYGMFGDRFAGHEVWTVQAKVREAVERARRGEGASFLEIDTYRFRGHSMSDPAKYRTQQELDKKKEEEDPVLVARRALIAGGVNERVIDAIDLEVDAEIEAAVKFAEEAEPAREAVMMGTVYAPDQVDS